MPKNPTDLSLEILEKVDGFYSESFEKLSNFYSESFSYLFSYAAGFGVVALFVLGLFFEGQRRSLKKRSQESEKRMNDLKNHYEEKLSQELKNFHSSYEQEKKNFELRINELRSKLEKNIKLSQARSLSYQAAASPVKSASLLMFCSAVEGFIEAESDEFLSDILGHLLTSFNENNRDSKIGEVLLKNLQSLLSSLCSYNKKRNGLYSVSISKLEEEIAKAKKS